MNMQIRAQENYVSLCISAALFRDDLETSHAVLGCPSGAVDAAASSPRGAIFGLYVMIVQV